MACIRNHFENIIEENKFECEECGEKIIYSFWNKECKWSVLYPGEKEFKYYKTSTDLVFSRPMCKK